MAGKESSDWTRHPLVVTVVGGVLATLLSAYVADLMQRPANGAGNGRNGARKDGDPGDTRAGDGTYAQPLEYTAVDLFSAPPKRVAEKFLLVTGWVASVDAANGQVMLRVRDLTPDAPYGPHPVLECLFGSPTEARQVVPEAKVTIKGKCVVFRPEQGWIQLDQGELMAVTPPVAATPPDTRRPSDRPAFDRPKPGLPRSERPGLPRPASELSPRGTAPSP